MSETNTNAEIATMSFVKQYYHILNEEPHYLHIFYNEPCLFNRPDPATHVKKTFWTKKEVKDEFLATRYEDYKAEIETSLGIPYPMEDGRVIVFVNGYLTRKKDNVRRKFTQTFLLAQQTEGLSILNDTFRFKEMQTQMPTPHEPAATESQASLSKKASSKGGDDDEWLCV
ncbi:putative G3BP-like protein [Capsella rubella]|uniref:putative G3BP-like protein n=1 Tax=Capsella rubella TaxID=81985 RepID=UPI000CD58C44|nr:putative G3BP-like protein [Capsella rubella]